MPNQTQIGQERIYIELLNLHDNSPISQGDEKFNFWIRPQATVNRTTGNQEWYRFNRGNTGYSNIGIVKVGSRSALQIVGFHTTDFLSYYLNILNRDQDYLRIKKGTTLSDQDVDAFFTHIIGAFPRTKQTFTNDVDAAQWMYDTYQDFFKEVKNYDSANGTPFYDILKIDDATFLNNQNKNNSNMALVKTLPINQGPQQPQINTTPVKPSIPLNQILYGPPGTGKTYHTVDKSLEILMSIVPQKREDQKKEFDNFKNQGRIVFTTFHQSMSYEDFIEGIKPETVNGTVEYHVKPGIFKELCEKAKNDQENPYVLIIDEINRGNVSQIFGELITLIEPDKRLGNENELTAKLPYSPKDEFGVPNNLYIIGTMNTADRSVEAIDTALRRRFSFVEMMPKPELLDGINCTINGKSRTLKELLEIINKRIVVLKDREHQIGHSYFMKWNAPTTIAVDDLTSIFKNNIVPLLQEYFYGNYQNIGLVLGDEFVKKETFGLKFASGFEDDFDGDTDTLRVLTDEEWGKKLNMDAALTALINE